MERRLNEIAARSGQSAAEFARRVVEDRLRVVSLLPDGLPPDSPEELVALASQQGIEPISDPSRLMGDWSDDPGKDDTDVDSFLELLRRQRNEEFVHPS
jgi:hypothetical protein